MKFKAVYLGQSLYVVSKKSETFDKIALKKVNPKVLIFFLFLPENIFCGYSLEAPRGDASMSMLS